MLDEIAVASASTRRKECVKEMSGIETPPPLLKRWIHSHEEDSANEMVLRPHTFQFPPSRGRSGYEFRADGSFVDIGIAPADGPEESAGTWRLEDDDKLVLSGADPRVHRTLHVVSVDEDRLVLGK